MSNKTILVLDLSNYQYQCIETLVSASILEKKYDSCAILDLNALDNNHILAKEKIKWTKRNDISRTRIFDRSVYVLFAKKSELKDEQLSLVNSLKKNNNVLIINSNITDHKDNSFYFDISNEIVVFANFKESLSKKILSIFLNQPIKNKKVYIIFYNYKENVQNAKTYINMLKSFRGQNIELIKLETEPNIRTLKEIACIDPWNDLYKAINTKL